MANSEHATPAADRVSWTQLVAYGSGGVIPIALFNIAGQLMGLLGNISLGLSAFWLGSIMIVPRLWDALSDPIIGHLSDVTRSRWGRRRPYILLGGIAVAVTFVGMWWAPRGEWVRSVFASEAAFNWFQLAYILAGLLLFFTACNLFEIPHGALGMELSNDYHERTRLFSAKSFLGNLFAMGTPWLMFLAGLEFFRGTSGALHDGMRYVSLFIAAALIPLSLWWFRTLREPALETAASREQQPFWDSMRQASSNGTFMRLTGAIFILAMGFNFVSLFNYYITIFYLYGGDALTATSLLGWGGTVWAITGLASVFPLNALSRRLGKHKTLLFAIALMVAAQASKIVCYDPTNPYLVLIPTVLLSAGMLMFFTLGSSMIGDICDENELRTGKRMEGTFYSVYWWFIKLGSAFASFVTGILLLYTQFDEKQNVAADALLGAIATVKSDAESWQKSKTPLDKRQTSFNESMEKISKQLNILRARFNQRAQGDSDYSSHAAELVGGTSEVEDAATAMSEQGAELVREPAKAVAVADRLANLATQLKKQAPPTLFRLRVVEIGLPALLSIGSVLLLLNYPLTEARCYEIKAELEKRRAEAAAGEGFKSPPE